MLQSDFVLVGCSIVFVSASFVLLILWQMVQEKRHAKERKELYDRLMARDLSDYRINAQQEPLKKATNHVSEAIRRAEREARTNMTDE